MPDPTPHDSHPAADPRRVLVVDDDPSVGNAIRRVLYAFQVTYAQSATGAIGRIQAGGEFSAVVCDAFMPGMSGFEFHAELARVAPALARRLVLVTGFDCAPEVEAFTHREGVRCVPKPFSPTELRAAVDEAARR